MLKRSALCICLLALLPGSVTAAEPTALKTDRERLSYSIGASIGKNLKSESTDVDLDLLIEGLKASLTGTKALLSDQEVRQVMNDYQVQMRQRATAKRQQATVDNKQKGEAFLARYRMEPGVLALPSGVLYRTIKAGDGRKPLETDTVEVNYRGTLTNGTEFDATQPGHPASLRVAALIPGWKQALSQMPTGSKWQVVIPAELAYGDRGVGGDIGPNEVLVFEVELLAIR